jgi:hypothetical protein
MQGVGFDPTLPVFEGAKTVQALGRKAAVIGLLQLCFFKILFLTSWKNLGLIWKSVQQK